MPTRQLTLPFGPVRNSGLLSNHWLEHRLELEPEYAEYREQAEAILNQLEQLWQVQKNRVEHYGDEAGLEQAFIQPVLERIGWKIKYQTLLQGMRPDYALFLDDAALDGALHAGRDSAEFWRFPSMLADAKAWHVSLDQRSTGSTREYPPEQIDRYLLRSNLPYAILTNGRQWRLIPRQLSHDQRRYETYLECDLPRILGQWAAHPSIAEREEIIRSFLQFFLFFSPAACRVTEGRAPLIARAIEGSSEYRLGVGQGLRERVYDALRLCIEGLVRHPPNAIDAAQGLMECRQQSFTLLYRLLFVMYAEDRRLLPYRVNHLYTNNRSLARHRDEIAGRLDRIRLRGDADYDSTSTNLWLDLKELFDLIDRGRRTYGVPAYNGGLFDPETHPFLQAKAIGDWHMARIIDQLSRAFDPHQPEAGLVRVDYRDLAIQHLGGVYEGLLEQQPFVVQEPMIVIRKRSRERLIERAIPEGENIPAGFEETGERHEPGDIAIQNEKGERRASGSYYTPDGIVNYIVDKTLGPLCRSIQTALESEIAAVESEHRHARGQRRDDLDASLERLRGAFDDRVLKLRVLDPAMGSGHFLLRACQYLAEEIATNPLTRDPAADRMSGEESLLTFWKRRVVERCLYGVDLNPMAVELAKLAMWLETVSTHQPLTFLDHHLRCGNSLVGARVDLLGVLPGSPPLLVNAVANQVAARLPVLLRPLAEIQAMSSDTFDQVKEKDRLYTQAFDRVRQPFLKIAHLWTSAYFLPEGQEPTPNQYALAVSELGAPIRFERLTTEEWFERGLKAAGGGDVRAFHWELEFPEVFFGESGPSPEAGFDAVIGNPPYDVLSELETGRDLSRLKAYIAEQSVFGPSIRGKNNLYKLFICKSIDLLKIRGRLGFITPMAVLGDDQAAEIRKLLLLRGAFTSVDAFPQKDDPTKRVFPEAKLSTAVFTVERVDDVTARNAPFKCWVHPEATIELTSPVLQMTSSAIPLYDPKNLTIVSCDQKDWDLATRIVGSGRMKRLGAFASFSQGEVNETNERKKGTLSSAAEGGRLVTRGAAVCLYVTRPASQGDDLYLNVDRFLAEKGPHTKAFHFHHRRVVWQESSPQNNFRRIIAAKLDANEFCNHTINYALECDLKYSLDFVIGLLNSKIAEWYFRLGSTNAHVSQYQVENLPSPEFHDTTPQDHQMLSDAIAARRSGDLDAAGRIVAPGLIKPPFSPAVRDLIAELVKRIMQIEAGRGNIARNERSSLAPEAQPYQDLIDRLFFAMAGLTPDESAGLEDRLTRML